MKRSILWIAAAALCGLALVSGCSNGDNNNNNGSQVIGLWETTSVANGNSFQQQDRLARPIVNEVFGTVANNRHQINNTDNPADDHNELSNDIQTFMTTAAGRSQPTIDAIKSVLVPDVMKADLSQGGNAS